MFVCILARQNLLSAMASDEISSIVIDEDETYDDYDGYEKRREEKLEDEESWEDVDLEDEESLEEDMGEPRRNIRMKRIADDSSIEDESTRKRNTPVIDDSEEFMTYESTANWEDEVEYDIDYSESSDDSATARKKLVTLEDEMYLSDDLRFGYDSELEKRMEFIRGEVEEFSSEEETKGSLRKSKRVKGMLTVEEIVLDGLNRDLNGPVSIRNAGIKGRGVFANSFIPRHTYVCEYKTTNIYSRTEYEKREKEMAINEETCAIIEHRVGKSTFYFDTTRRYNQLGKYMNHGRKDVNVRVHRPLAIRGKLRLGMYTITDINEGDELLWDYGITRSEMPWEEDTIKDQVPKEDDEKDMDSKDEEDICEVVERKENFEKYRKSYYCPIPSCHSKSIKKLADHLRRVHSITNKNKRMELLKKAKELGPAKPKSAKHTKVNLTIEEAFRTTANIIRPKTVVKIGSTRHYKRYSESIPQLQSFESFLTNFTGGSRSSKEAKQIVTDVSKVIAYCSPNQFTWNAILNHHTVKQYYIDKVKNDGVGPDGILTKLDRICRALDYMALEVDECEGSGQEIIAMKSRMDGWKSSFKKDRPKVDFEREARKEGKEENVFKALTFIF